MSDVSRFKGNPNKKRKRHTRKPSPPGTLKIRELAPYVKVRKRATARDMDTLGERLSSVIRIVTNIKLSNPDLLVACVDELLNAILDANFPAIATRWIDIIGGVPYDMVEVDGILRPVAIIEERVIDIRRKVRSAEASKRRRVRQRQMEDNNIRKRETKALWQAEYRTRKREELAASTTHDELDVTIDSPDDEILDNGSLL